MTSRPAANDRLSDLLLTLAVETDMSNQAVREAIDEAPEFETDILAFALEWGVMICEVPAYEHRPQVVAQTNYPEAWVAAAAATPNPFAGKGPSDLRALATLCDLPYSLLGKLCQRLIDATTIPLVLIRSLASNLNIDAADLLAFLDQRPTLAAADYRAVVRPGVADKVSFASAIRSTDMSDQHRDKWLILSE